LLSFWTRTHTPHKRRLHSHAYATQVGWFVAKHEKIMKSKILGMVLFAAMVLASCAQAAKIAPTKTTIPQPTLTIPTPPLSIPPVQPLPTPTEFQLPFNDTNVESEYCNSPAIKLSFTDAQSLGDDEIAGKLIDLWLAYFNAAQAPDWCRIDGYKIDEVYYDRHALTDPPVEPQGDIMRIIRFSIKLIQIPNFWMSLAGEVDTQNWFHTARAAAVFRSAYGYTMKFANP
jgi:hypothetical protein